jgi:hypothetical protein
VNYLKQEYESIEDERRRTAAKCMKMNTSLEDVWRR